MLETPLFPSSLLLARFSYWGLLCFGLLTWFFFFFSPLLFDSVSCCFGYVLFAFLSVFWRPQQKDVLPFDAPDLFLFSRVLSIAVAFAPSVSLVCFFVALWILRILFV